jgi:hypothetical protein
MLITIYIYCVRLWMENILGDITLITVVTCSGLDLVG